MYREFALPYEQRVNAAIHAADGLAKLHVCGNTSALLEDMACCGADLYNVDHMVDFDRAATVYGAANRAFKGNLDPVEDLLRSTPQKVTATTRDRIDRAAGKKFLLSAGCEIPAATSDAVLHAFCSTPSQ